MPRAPLDLEQLELLPDGRRIALLRERPEDQWFDRKSWDDDPDIPVIVDVPERKDDLVDGRSDLLLPPVPRPSR